MRIFRGLLALLVVPILASVAVPREANAQDPGYSPYVLKSNGLMTGPLKFKDFANGSEPFACNAANAGKVVYSTTDGTLRICNGAAWTSIVSAMGSVAFSSVTAGTNAAALVVGTGGSLSASGSGTINATTLNGATFAAPTAIGSGTPAAGTFTTLAADTVTAPTVTGSYPAVGTSSGPEGILAINPTSAAAGVPQYSPNVTLESQQWISGDAVSRSFRWMMQNRPTQHADSAKSTLVWRASAIYLGGSFDRMSLDQDGLLTVATLAAGSGSPFAVASSGAITGRVSLLLDTATATDDRIKLLPFVGGAARFTGTITTADLSADRTITLADVDGTVYTTGNPPTSVSGNAGSATYASAVTVADDTTTNATMYPLWVTAATGNLATKLSSTKLSFNPSTGLLTSTGFSGPLTGNVTGNVSGSSSSTTGNAATATILATTRAINGTNFNGSADITANLPTTQVSTSASFFPVFVASSSSGVQVADIGTGLSFNPSTNVLTTTTFSGALSGNATTASTVTGTGTNTATSSQLGVVSTTTGLLQLAHASSSFLTTLTAGNAAAARTWTWPANFGAAACVLTDAAGDGVLSCAAASGGVTSLAGTALQITASAATGAVTLSLPSAVTLPGSLIVTTTSSHLGAMSQTTDAIATAQTVGLLLQNTTQADGSGGGNSQYSPAIKFLGSARKTTATAATHTDYGLIQYRAVTGGARTQGIFSFYTNLNAAGEFLMADLVVSSSSGASLAFGAGANVGFVNNCTFIGPAAGNSTQSGNNNTGVGNGILTNLTSGTDNFAGGYLSGNGINAASFNTFVGSLAGYTGSGQLTTAQNSIAIGYSAGTTANSQGTLGSINGTTDWYIGYGFPTKATPSAVTLQVAGGTGTDNVAGAFNIAGGKSTGAGAVSVINFQTGTILATASTAQTLATHLTVGGGVLTTGIAPITFANAHLSSTQTTKPTTTLTSTTLNDGAGSGASITVANGSTDNKAVITITAGNGVPTAGIAGQLVFQSAFASAPTCTLQAIDTGGFARFLYVSATAVDKVTIAADAAFVTGTAHSYNVLCME